MELQKLNLTEISKIKELFRNLLLNNAAVLQSVLKGGGKVKALIFLGFVFVYLYRQASKTKISRVFRKTQRNIAIVRHLKPLIRSFKPTFYLPTALSLIIKGNICDSSVIKYETQTLTLPDGEELNVEWHPLEYATLEPETPIVVFILGACGSSTENYCRVLSQYVRKQGWRIAVINRRGFGQQRLKTNRFMHKNEFEDIQFTLQTIKDIFDKASIYLIGVSAGANNSAKYLGLAGENSPVTAYCSISNPFHIGRVSYSMKFSLWGKFFSKIIATNYKKVVVSHLMAPQFEEFIKKNFNSVDCVLDEMQNLDTCWKVDKFLNTKFCGKLNRPRNRV